MSEEQSRKEALETNQQRSLEDAEQKQRQQQTEKHIHILKMAEEQSRRQALEADVQRSLERAEQKRKEALLEHRLQQAEELLAQREQALADSKAENQAQKISMTQTIDQIRARVAEFEESQQVAHNDLASAGAEKDAEIATKDVQIVELKEHSMRLDRQLAEESEKQEALAHELVDLQRREAELKKLSAEKDAEIAAKDGHIEELKVHSTRLDSKLVEELEKSLTKSFYREKALRS